jgi:hypothetical protein
MRKKLMILILGVLLLSPLFAINTVKADDNGQLVDLTKTDGNGEIVAVTTLTHLYSKNDSGNFTLVGNRSLGAMTTWYTDQLYTINGTGDSYLRVSTNEWVKTNSDLIVQSHNYKMDAQVDNYQNINAKTIKINNQAAPVYNDFGVKTGQTVPADSSWKVDMSYMVGIPGLDSFATYQRIGNNAWIRTDTNATVIDTL